MTRRRASSPFIRAALDAMAEVRAEWHLVREAEYHQAVEATSGQMVNAAGRARGITSWDLFTGTRQFAQRWGTDELREHLAAHPRTTWAAYEREAAAAWTP